MSAEVRVAGIKLKLDKHSKAFEAAVDKAESENLVERIWARDHTVWNKDPAEISNRLGWLDIASRMRGEIPELKKFAAGLKAKGFTHALLLGMGGSSLAAEFFSQVFTGKDGLKLNILDSTDPDAVRAYANSLDPKNTLYIVSSKSGGTIETISFFKFFYNLAQNTLGSEVGQHFVAITDPGSGLAKIAADHNFRQTFLADPNIGGRYSALSHFGLLPAALIGADISKLIDSAEEMMQRCSAMVPVDENPAAVLGLAMGTLAKSGCYKASFLLSSAVAGFGSWVEQLIAESTGKQSTGILPVVGEPLTSTAYGDDILFIGFDENSTDQFQGHPAIEIGKFGDYDLGGQFFLWEFATAVAGYVLGINPFDQPNVESAKVQTRQLVDDYIKYGKLPKAKLNRLTGKELVNFLSNVRPRDYISLQPYMNPTLAVDEEIAALRFFLLNKYQVATTAGCGPRFLHSTGQLHKGDRGNGLFIQFITKPAMDDLPIPKQAGSPESEISFGVLKLAQAQGDAEALRAAGRRVISFEIEGDPAIAFKKLLSEMAA